MFRSHRVGTAVTISVFASAALLATACGSGQSTSASNSSDSVGITDTQVKVGLSFPLSGPLSIDGIPVSECTIARFEQANAAGGVKSADGKTRKIKWYELDDAYNPAQTLSNAREFVEQDHVFALVQIFGTPNNLAIENYTTSVGVPQLFGQTGSALLGSDPAKYPGVIGWGGTFEGEGATAGKYVAEHLPNATVAVLRDTGEVGPAYLAGFEAATAGTKIKILTNQTFQATDTSVDSQVATLAATHATVFLDLAYGALGPQAIRQAYQLGWHPTQFVLSADSDIPTYYKPAGYDAANGILDASYLVDPSNPLYSNLPGVKSYVQAIAKYGHGADADSNLCALAYGTTDTFIKTLEAMKTPTRSGLISALQSLRNVSNPVTIPGITITVTKNDYYPIHQFQLQRFDASTLTKVNVGPMISAGPGS